MTEVEGVRTQPPLALRHAAGRCPLHDALDQRPSAPCTVHAPAAGSGWSAAQLQIEASRRPSAGSSWSKPKRLTPQRVIAATFAGVSRDASRSLGELAVVRWP